MKSIDDFRVYYCEKYRNRVWGYSEELVKKIRKEKIKVLILELLFFLLIMNVFFHSGFSSWNILFSFVFLFLMVVILVLVFISLVRYACSSFMVDINRKIYVDLISFLSGDEVVEYYANKQVAKKVVERTNLFDLEQLGYTGNNYTRFSYKNSLVTIADVYFYKFETVTSSSNIYSDGYNYLRTFKRKVREDIFKGVYLDIEFNKKIDSLVYLIPKGRSKVKKYLSCEGVKVLLENMEFNKKYVTYTVDEHNCRYILSLPLMEKINSLDGIIGKRKYMTFKEDGRIGIFIEEELIERFCNRWIKLKGGEITFKYLEDFWLDISKFLEVYERLDLEKNLFGN